MKKFFISSVFLSFALFLTSCALIREDVMPIKNDPVALFEDAETNVPKDDKQVVEEIMENPLLNADAVANNAVGYRNEKFGFTLNLPGEYKGFTTKMYDDSVHFFVDSEGTTWPYDTFDVFTISAFSHAWWEENNVQVKDEILLGGKEGDKVAFVPGINDPTGSLGGYLGKNNTYYFTLGRGHDCPGNTLNPDEFTWQCELFRNVPQALRDFDVFDI